MKIDLNSDKPIFIQFAESIEDNILNGVFEEQTQIPSTTEVAIMLKINPATANKGVNLLVEDNIVYKRRGIGMFVSDGAKEIIKKKRKKGFTTKYVYKLVNEAKKLNICYDEIIKIIEKEWNND